LAGITQLRVNGKLEYGRGMHRSTLAPVREEIESLKGSNPRDYGAATPCNVLDPTFQLF